MSTPMPETIRNRRARLRAEREEPARLRKENRQLRFERAIIDMFSRF